MLALLLAMAPLAQVQPKPFPFEPSYSGPCKFLWKTTEWSTGSADVLGGPPQKITDSNAIASAGYSLTLKVRPSTTTATQGLVSQAGCDPTSSHSGFGLLMKGTKLSYFLSSQDCKGSTCSVEGPPFVAAYWNTVEMRFVPAESPCGQDPTARPSMGVLCSGTVHMTVNVTKPNGKTTTATTSTPGVNGGGWSSYHYPWRVGVQGGGGTSCCFDNPPKPPWQPCGKSCNPFSGDIAYAAMCVGKCAPGECALDAAEATSAWGEMVLIALAAVSGGYVVFGVAVGRRLQGKASPEGRRGLMSPQAHREFWRATLPALVRDGIAFSAAVARGGGGGGGGGSEGKRRRRKDYDEVAGAKPEVRRKGKEKKDSSSSSKKAGKSSSSSSSWRKGDACEIYSVSAARRLPPCSSPC